MNSYSNLYAVRGVCLKLLVDAGVSSERKSMLREVMKGGGLDVIFMDEATQEQLDECQVLLQSFGAASRIAGNVSRARNLRMIQTISAGVDSLPFESIPPGIMICSNAGAFSEPIAEHVFGMILSLSKKLKLNESKMRSGKFDQEGRTTELRGLTLGVLGYGGIGKAVAAIGRCFGMKIYGISRDPSNLKSCDFHGGMDKLDNMLSVSDVVVISIPLNKSTRGLIDAGKLSLMKGNAILVNVARGHVIVENDLYAHLKSHPSFSAGIDAWWKEPRHGENFEGNLDFLSLPNVVGSPHNSGIVEGMDARIVRKAIANILRFVSGQEPLNIVNREDYLP